MAKSSIYHLDQSTQIKFYHQFHSLDEARWIIMAINFIISKEFAKAPICQNIYNLFYCNFQFISSVFTILHVTCFFYVAIEYLCLCLFI